MSEIVDESLKKIAKGSGIILVGTILDIFFRFIGRVIVVRYITITEYGLYSLALVVMTAFFIVSTLGLQQGSARYIAYFRGKTENEKIRAVIHSSTKIAIVSGIIFSLILFLMADYIALSVFRNPNLYVPLKIFSLAIPFRVLISIFLSFFQGFDNARPNVYFESVLRKVIFLSMLIAVILLDLSFTGVLYAFVISFVVTCIALGIYTVKNLPLTSVNKFNFGSGSTGKELLFFSAPLLGVTVLNMVMGWVDTLMLGYFKTADVVGLYNAALPLANLIPIALSAASFLYIPIATGLYSKELITELHRTYQVLTKWIFSITVPLFFILFLFSEMVLNLFFGPAYVPSSMALRILLLGFMFHTVLGLNSLSLMVMGETRFLMLSTFFVFILNVVMNATLIPVLGIMGAAIATLFSYFLRNIFCSAKLYTHSKINPFSKNYLKSLGISVFLISLVYVFISSFEVDYWVLPILLFLFVSGYGLLLVITKSFDKEDIDMVIAIEKRIGIDLKLIKKLFRKFN